MNDINKSHEIPWGELESIQLVVERGRRRNSAEAFAVEEAYSNLIDEVTNHTFESLRRRFQNLVSNRIAKFQRREMIERTVTRMVRARVNGSAGESDNHRVDGDSREENVATTHYRRRDEFVERLAARSANCGDPAVLCARDEQVRRVRALLLPDDWRVVWELASGHSYAELAVDHGVSVGTLKARVARMRARIRKATGTVCAA